MTPGRLREGYELPAEGQAFNGFSHQRHQTPRKHCDGTGQLFLGGIVVSAERRDFTGSAIGSVAVGQSDQGHFELASRGQVEEAERLWQDALSRNPGLEAAAIKLASAQLLRGDQAAANATIRRARRYVPDLEWKTR